MSELWSEIPSFPGYSVSNYGRVRNEKTGYLLALLFNNTGVVQVGLMRDLQQHRRSVPLLVARAFIPKEPLQAEAFDTPINLNGDRTDNRAANLLWRPNWFARRYHRQFYTERPYPPAPVQDIETEEIFESPMHAAVKFGLLEYDILVSIFNNEFVWPTYQRFRQTDIN